MFSKILKLKLNKIIFSTCSLIILSSMGETLHANENVITQEKKNTTLGEVDSILPINDLNKPSEKQLTEEINRYRRLVQSETYDEADNSAKRAIGLAIQIFGTESKEFARALINLGILQNATGQYDAAAQNFNSAIEIIESVDDRLNLSLVEPLKGLGISQLEIGDLIQAKKTLNKAVHITHVNEGPHNLIQMEILESIVEADFRMENIKDVKNTLERINILNLKKFEGNSIALLPILTKHADWQNRLGYFRDERETYKKIIRIIESNYDKNSKLLIDPLIKIGKSFYFIDKTIIENERGMLTGEMYFKRAIRIAEKTDDISDREYINTKLALADCYIYEGLVGRARAIYANIWRYLSTNDERLLLRNEYLSEPVQIIEARPLPRYAINLSDKNIKPDETATGTINVSYNVSARGRVQNVKTKASPKEFFELQQIVQREIRNRVYRPKIINGKPVARNTLTFEHTFSYNLTDLEDIREN